MGEPMNRRAAVFAMLALPLGARLRASAPAARVQESWTPLFNGKDLAGWDTWLGKPHKLTDLPGLPRNEQGEYAAADRLEQGSASGLLGRARWTARRRSASPARSTAG